MYPAVVPYPGMCVVEMCAMTLPFLKLWRLPALLVEDFDEVTPELLRAVEDFAPRAPARTRDAWQRVAVPACRGLLAHARGDHGRAVDELRTRHRRRCRPRTAAACAMSTARPAGRART